VTTPVVFGAKAHADILALYDFIAERDGADRAAAYLKRIETFCRSLGTLPLRAHDETISAPAFESSASNVVSPSPSEYKPTVFPSFACSTAVGI